MCDDLEKRSSEGDKDFYRTYREFGTLRNRLFSSKIGCFLLPNLKEKVCFPGFSIIFEIAVAEGSDDSRGYPPKPILNFSLIVRA